MALELTTQPRSVLGKKVRHLRRDGVTPVNVYGAAIQPRALQAHTRDLQVVLRRAGTNTLINLVIEGESGSTPVMFKQIQSDPIKQQILHVDMHAVNLKQRLVVEVPIAYTGDSPAANSASRMLLTQLSTLSVECLPTNIPSSFQVDITHLNNEGDLVQVKQVTAPADVTILNDPEDVMIRVVLSRAGAREAAKGGAPTAAEAEDAVAEGETTDESTSSDDE